MSRRVLVADDSATIQKVIKIAFSRHELEIVEAASLIEALASASRTPIDVLILDASLPGARGPSDFAKLRSVAGDVPALLLCGTYDSIDEDAFRQAGFVHFLKKPFESSDIVSKVDELLGSYPAGELEATPPPPLGRPQHPTMIVTGGAFDPTRPPPSSPTLTSAAPGSAHLAGGDDEDDEPRLTPPPPPPALDHTRKGRRAFAEGEDTAPSRAPGATGEETDPRRSPAAFRPGVAATQVATVPTGSTGGAVAKSVMDGAMAALEDQLPGLVRQAVEDYCERHFKSIAREIIATELRRLADEKARHLVDN